MRDYVLPAATFQQEFQLLAQAVQQTLYTCIVGPKRKVVKEGLSPSSETNYGTYDPALGNELDFLGLPAGENVDADTVDVRLTDVYGRYAYIDAAAGIEATAVPNEIKLHNDFETTRRFAAFNDGTTTHDRLSDLGERDVRVGDYVKVDHQTGTLWTRVKGLVQATSAVAVSVATPNASSNPANQVAGITNAPIDTIGTTRGLAEYGVQVTAYGGDLAKGLITDIYTIEVTKAGAADVAEAKITSIGGDNDVDVVLTTAGNAIGANGLVASFASTSGAYKIGEKWTITAKSAYTQKTLTAVTSTYSGLIDTTYQIKVIKGGAWASNPKVSVTTNNNVDSSGAVVVVGDLANIQLGSIGPVVEFAAGAPQDGLRLGDIYNVVVTAAKSDGARTLQLQAPLPQTDGGVAKNQTGYDLKVSFMVKQDSHTIPVSDYPEPGDLNWVLGGGGDSISLEAGISITDATVLDGTGNLLSLPVEKASIAIYYTAPLALQANRIGIISSQAAVADILGDVVPENELAFGVDMALRNSGGIPVYYLSTAGDTIADFTKALGEAEKNDDLYFMVPMSQDIDVQSLFKSHVINMSSETNGLERVAIVSRTVASEKALFVLKENDTAWSGYIAAGPEMSPIQYRQVTMPDATFVASGVEPGDILKTNFSITVGGEEVHETYIVEEVIDDENLLIATGPSAPVGAVGNTFRMEISHIYTTLEKAQLAAAQSEYFGDRRVSNVFPDEAITTGGDTVPGHYLAAAYAGIKSSVVAHQPITNVEVTGFLSVPKVLNGYTREELNEIAGGGTMIVTQELEGGKLFIRHSITTDMTDVNQSELAITTNVDAITKYLRQWIKPLIGQYNITPEFLIMLETLSSQRLDYLVQETQTVKAGPQIVEVGTIRAVQDADVRTKILMTIPLTLPYAANNITTKLVIV